MTEVRTSPETEEPNYVVVQNGVGEQRKFEVQLASAYDLMAPFTLNPDHPICAIQRNLTLAQANTLAAQRNAEPHSIPEIIRLNVSHALAGNGSAALVRENSAASGGSGTEQMQARA